MTNLIIGHRGFVGSNLSRLMPYCLGAGRAEISALAGTEFTNIYCAAPQAKKWWANQNPEEDKQEVANLIETCRQIACTGHFVLFSTVDIYDPPTDKTEHDKPGVGMHPYGAHRFYLEQSILEHFGPHAMVIRLPALVGRGLKKNVIYDLINNNNIEQINANSSFQWFNLAYLKDVLNVAIDAGACVLNVACEPLSTADLVNTWFPSDLTRLNWNGPPICYDIRTAYGQPGKTYLYSKEEVIEMHLRPFIESEMAER